MRLVDRRATVAKLLIDDSIDPCLPSPSMVSTSAAHFLSGTFRAWLSAQGGGKIFWISSQNMVSNGYKWNNDEFTWYLYTMLLFIGQFLQRFVICRYLSDNVMHLFASSIISPQFVFKTSLKLFSFLQTFFNIASPSYFMKHKGALLSWC